MQVYATTDDGIVVEESQTTEESSEAAEETPEETETSEETEVSEETETSEETEVPEETETSEESSEQDENKQETQNPEAENDNLISIPDVVGMTEGEALAAFEQAGLTVEIIKTYEYSEEVETDVVYEQSVSGEVNAADVLQVQISISLGAEPAEILGVATQEVSPISTFGLATDIQPKQDSYNSRYGVDWDSLPESYEYNWDNSENCWSWGNWMDTDKDGQGDVCYKTERGTYDTNVRHKMQMYCDGTYVYLRIIIATIYESHFNGEDYQFHLDGNMAAFQLTEKDSTNVITGNILNWDPGVYNVSLRHRNSSMSYEIVPDGDAWVTVHDDHLNTELEMRVPLSEMKRQNDAINLDTLNTIEFFTPNLMYRRIMSSGADTMPLASAVAALLVIPGSSVLLHKHAKKKKHADKVTEEIDEENV